MTLRGVKNATALLAKTRSLVDIHAMAKPTITFVCTECGGESLRWAGQCPHCQAWNTLQEFQVRKAQRGREATKPLQASRPVPLNEIDSEHAPRKRLGWDELNRVLGGGIVPGSLVL